MENSLIFDVGAHKGEDTAFYLSKGFRVIAIEANPAFCKLIESRCREAVDTGALVILNTAIAKHEGTTDFFVNEEVSEWGTTRRDWVERNRQLGASSITQITVPCRPLSTIVKQHGTPYYCKIDIEGLDAEALASLAGNEIPQFVSIEATKTNWADLVEEFKIFRSLGYRKFKVVDQSLVSFQDCPEPPLAGKFVDHKFEPGSSGLFGNETPGQWLSSVEALQLFKGIFRGYALNGDQGLFSADGRNLFYRIGEWQQWLFRRKGAPQYISPVWTFPPPGWYDTHATR